MVITQTGDTKVTRPRRNLLKTTIPVSPGDKIWPSQVTNCYSLQRVTGSRSLYPQRWALPPQGTVPLALGKPLQEEDVISSQRMYCLHSLPPGTLLNSNPHHPQSHLSFLCTAKNLSAPGTTFYSNYRVWQGWPALSGSMA